MLHNRPRMKSSVNFFLAARQCEMAELEELARTIELVLVLARLAHALQRERGTSHVFLTSGGRMFAPQRLQQIELTRAMEAEVRLGLDQLDTSKAHPRNGARLFSRVAVLLHTMDGLDALRDRVASQALPPQEAIAAYVKLVAGLLAVVFEAADSATDPQISRALVALFNFMQGKEFAGQERAHGAGAFARGHVDDEARQHWLHLIDQQQSCFEAFCSFASPATREAGLDDRDPQGQAELERMRRLGCTRRTPFTEDPETLSMAWYACCTRRIDGMHAAEPLLAQDLRALCEKRIAEARGELSDQQAMLEALARQAGEPTADAAAYGPHVERAVLAMMQEQARRLQTVSDELRTVRANLEERKLVERAKGLLMAHRQMSEEEAYRTLRRMAMDRNRRMGDVAMAVLALADILPAPR